MQISSSPLSRFVKTTIATVALSAITLPASAKTAELATCSFDDLSGVTVTVCAGFFGGNLISNSPANFTEVKNILSSVFGVSSASGTWVQKLDSLNGSKTIDFLTPLSGTTIVALHFGAGNGGPGNGTAFYQFDAGTNLDTFTTKFSAASNAAVYVTSPVPEPETYVMMLAGLGLIGGIARHRKQKLAA